MADSTTQGHRTPANREHTLLLDHDNLPRSTISIEQILIVWIFSIHDAICRTGIHHVRVRSYGGWFSGTGPSQSRFEASDYYQNHCPPIFRSKGTYVRVTFEFADTLIVGPFAKRPPQITNTHVSRNSTQTVRLRAGAAACIETGCELPAVRRWVRKSKACFRDACPHQFADQFTRDEQKQVDVHLAIDFLSLAFNPLVKHHIAIASDDTDLLPAIASATINQQAVASISHIRFNNPTSYLDSFLQENGVHLVHIKPT